MSSIKNILNQYIISASFDEKIKIWRKNNHEKEVIKIIKTLIGHNSCINCIAIPENGLLFVTGSDDRTIKIWSAMIGKNIRILIGHRYWVYSIAINYECTAYYIW